MNSWEQVQTTLDYIELHLGEELRTEALAEMAGLSPFYYQHLFARLVKRPVAEYIRLRRMAKAVEELPKSDRKIVDIAMDLGYSSHEHFTRTFKETFGMTPNAYRQNPIRMNRMTKPELLLNYVVVDEGVPLITEGIVLEIMRKTLPEEELFIGHQGDFPFSVLQELGSIPGEDVLDALWKSLHAEKEKVAEIDQTGDEIGVVFQSEKQGHFTYFAGAKASAGVVPESYSAYRLPAGEYVVCSFEAENFEALVMDALYKAQKYLYEVWLHNHNIQTSPCCVERYQRHDADATQMELWLRIITE